MNAFQRKGFKWLPALAILAGIPSIFTSCPSISTSPGGAQWAQTVISGAGASQFNAIAVDSADDIYAAGYVSGTGQYDFGNSVTLTTTALVDNLIPVLVKYNSTGKAQWAQTVSCISCTAYSQFKSVAVDSANNVYAVGEIDGGAQYDFGNSVTAMAEGTGAGGYNLVLVKYSPYGVAQWARTVVAQLDPKYSYGSEDSWFNSVAVDSAGNIYAAGSVEEDGQYDFGNSVIVTETGSTDHRCILVRYDSSGTARWAQSGSGDSLFNSVAVDSSGDVYAAGQVGYLGNAASVIPSRQRQGQVIISFL